MTAAPALLLVGAGKMGGAFVAGWTQSGVAPERILAVEPNATVAQALTARYAVRAVADPGALGAFRPDLVVLAVKPQMMAAALPAYVPYARQGAAFLSIAAGRTIASFEAVLGAVPIVRAMPNTPAAIGQGITVACPNARAEAPLRALIERVLAPLGALEWIADEALMDAVTATSGSGPAYVFLLAECLAEAGAKAGLPRALAEKLARATVAGSGALLAASSETPEALRRAVTSPAGTTEAALKILMADGGLGALLTRAVDAAARRSRELSA